jgi:hypothetical protein
MVLILWTRIREGCEDKGLELEVNTRLKGHYVSQARYTKVDLEHVHLFVCYLSIYIMPKPSRPTKPAPRRAVVEDDYLDTDSEVDEFAAEQREAGPSGSSDEDVDEGDGDEDEEEEGVGQWQPDDWQGGDSEGSGSGSEDEPESGDEAVSHSSDQTRTMADYPAFARWQVYRILNKAKLTSRHPADPPVYSNEGAEGFEEGKEGSREGSSPDGHREAGRSESSLGGHAADEGQGQSGGSGA